MKIAVLGAGYVGLTTSACLAKLGHEITCCDIDAARMAALQRAEVPIYEPGLSDLVASQTEAGRLHFSSDAASAVQSAAAVFLAVGTPSKPDGDIDLTYVEAAAVGIAPHLRNNAVVILKSTVVAGTAAKVKILVDASRGRKDVSVASNPEFLRESSAIEDFLHADRIVIGTDDAQAEALLRELYRPLTDTGVPLLATSTIDAELIKYAANSLLALKIGFINDVADLCEALGGDVSAVADGVGRDRRIGGFFLTAGPGFGGSCFPKDTRAFASTGRQHGTPLVLIETLIHANEARKRRLATRIIDAAPRQGRVAILGTSFKANTDDVREAAALTIVPMLIAAGLEVHAHDPQPAAAKRLLSAAQWHDDPFSATRLADVAVVLTEWDEYRNIDLKRMAQVMRGRLLFDFRNIIVPEEAARAGLDYSGLGRRSALPRTTRRGQGTSPAISVAASPA